MEILGSAAYAAPLLNVLVAMRQSCLLDISQLGIQLWASIRLQQLPLIRHEPGDSDRHPGIYRILKSEAGSRCTNKTADCHPNLLTVPSSRWSPRGCKPYLAPNQHVL